MAKKLIVLGSINIDHVINVEQFPRPGETLLGSAYNISFGGKGANQAVAAGRGSADIQFIAAVGDDDVGRQVYHQLEQDNIDVKSVQTIENEKTGVALISVNKHGENQIVIYSGANSAVTPEYVENYKKDIINADAILMQLEIPIPTVEMAARLAKSNRTRVIVNPAPAQYLSDDLLKCIDIITPNETEAECLTDIKVKTENDANKASQFLHEKGIPIVIITLGSKGAWVSNQGFGQLIKGYRVRAIDTIAAGDTFNGMLVTALLEDKNLEEAVKYAHAAAAIAVTRRGAQASVPWRKEVEQFLQRK